MGQGLHDVEVGSAFDHATPTLSIHRKECPMPAVRPLSAADADACDAIVAGLPYHFGNEQGRADCARAVRSQPGLVAEDDGEVVGFLTYEPRFEAAAEITWMAVRADRRRSGIGRAMLGRLSEELVAGGRRGIRTRRS
jgi:ribosomal protein S18 acetylase RimI-like enzyme